jgi:hypothetical protein
MIHRIVDNIISFVYVQYTTWTDQYSSRYGPAKFDVAMASFEVKTRRAITLSILVRWRQFFHSNAVNDVEYRWCNRGTMGKRSDQTRHNIAAWRQISWFVDGIWRSCMCTVTFFYVLLYMVDIFEWEKHARGLNCFVPCATVDAMIVAFDTSDGQIILSLHTWELVLKIRILETKSSQVEPRRATS